MQYVEANEATAAGRVMTFPLVVDATDGLTPETGEATGQSQYSVDGGQNWTNTNGTLVGGSNGSYEVQLTQAEVNQSAGVTILGRYKSAATAEARAIPILIVPFDPLSAADLGLTALPTAAPGANGGLPTVNASNQVAGVSGNVVGSVGSVAGAVGSVTGAVGSVTGSVGGNVDGSTASVTGAVGSVTGNVGGNVTGSVGSVVGAVGSVTGNVGGNVTGSVGDLTATAVNKIWDDLTSGMTQAGSIGKLIIDYLDAQVSLCALEATVAALNDLAQSDILSDATPFAGGNIAELGAANIPADIDALTTEVTKLFGGAMGTPTAASFADEIMHKDGSQTFSAATDSLEALRDRGDAAWTTGGGGSGVNVTGIVSVPTLIDLADTATVRLSVHVLDTSDDLPTTGEITPGTISIDRKARAGTSWSGVVTDAACSESAGLVYYDEVFDDGTGYAVGDMLRITFKGQAVVIGANTHEIFPSGGSLWYARVSALNDISSGGDAYYALPLTLTVEPESHEVEVAVVEP